MSLTRSEGSPTLFQRDYVLLVCVNIVLMMVMPILIVLAGVAGAKLAPVEGLATSPATIQMLAGFLSAAPASFQMAKRGRKTVFLFASTMVCIAGLIGAAAMHLSSIALLWAAHFAFGAAMALVGFFRFAATEMVDARLRPQALSTLSGSTIFAALGAGVLLTWGRSLVASDALVGSYLSVCLLGVVGIVVLSCIDFGDRADGPPGKTSGQTASFRTSLTVLFSNPRVLAALICGAAANGLMVLMMTPTSLSMTGMGHAHHSAASVIQWHVVAMFAPGFLTGALIARFGAMRVAILGYALISASAVPTLIGLDVAHYYVSLIVLGVGWNFGYVSASTMIVQQLSDIDGKGVQGLNDTGIALTTALCSLASGLIVTQFGWSGIAWTTLCGPILIGCLWVWLATR